MSIIFGTHDPDLLFGTNDDDILFGFYEDDVVIGFGGNDIVFGGRGDDWITGGAGDDLVRAVKVMITLPVGAETIFCWRGQGMTFSMAVSVMTCCMPVKEQISCLVAKAMMR